MKLLKSLLLCLLAIVLSIFLMPIGLCFTVVYIGIHFNLFDYLSRFLLSVAISIDQLGNVVCQYLFNETLIQYDSKDRFGNPDHTISYVLGVNKETNKLSATGRILADLLNWIDKMHVEKAVKAEQSN